MATTQLTPRPGLKRTAGAPQRDAVVATPGSHLGGLPSASSELDGLLRGLGSMNSAVADIANTERAERDAAAKAAQRKQEMDDELAGRAAGQQANLDPLTRLPQDLPGAGPAAVGEHFAKGFSTSIAQRVGIDIAADAMADYHDKAKGSDFNLDSWLGETRRAALANVKDPIQVASIGEHLSQVEGQIRGDYERQRLTRLDAGNLANLNTASLSAFSAWRGPAQARQAADALMKQFDGQHPKATVVTSMLSALAHQSAKQGGMPELFDAFDEPGADGVPLRAFMDPATASRVDELKSQAVATRERALDAAAEPEAAQRLAAIDTRIKAGGKGLTLAGLFAEFGPRGAIRTRSELSSRAVQLMEAQEKDAAAGSLADLLAQGRGYRLKGDELQKGLSQLLDAPLTAMEQAVASGDTRKVAALAASMANIVGATGAVDGYEPLKRMITSRVGLQQSPNGPPPDFLAMAEVYRAFGANPRMRSMHFDEKTSDLLDAFISQPGQDPRAAYEAAHLSNTPEAKRAAAEFSKTEEGKKLMASKLMPLIGGIGAGSIPFIGGWFRPKESEAVRLDMEAAFRARVAADPGILNRKGALEAYRDEWLESNYVRDETTNTPVKVPAGLGGKAGSAAISAYTARLVEANPPPSKDWTPELRLMPDGAGTFQVFYTNGVAQKPVGTIPAQMIMQWHAGQSELSPQERALLGQVRSAMNDGKALPAELPPELLGKAVALKHLDESTIAEYRKGQREAIQRRIASIPDMGFSQAELPSLPILPAPRKGSNVDYRQTAAIAGQFLTAIQARPGGSSDHQYLAAALITSGEGVALRAYDDPAWGAGKNIGTGINLNANKDTIKGDLKAIGLDGPAADAVTNGTAALTPTQTRDLLLQVLPRYEAQAKKAAGDLWENLSAPQRAVLIDVAWQTGGVGKFPKAIEALRAGDKAAFQAEIQVTYEKSPGVRVIDKTRHGLRTALLAGVPALQARLGLLGKLPSNQLQAAEPAQ